MVGGTFWVRLKGIVDTIHYDSRGSLTRSTTAQVVKAVPNLVGA